MVLRFTKGQILFFTCWTQVLKQSLHNSVLFHRFLKQIENLSCLFMFLINNLWKMSLFFLSFWLRCFLTNIFCFCYWSFCVHFIHHKLCHLSIVRLTCFKGPAQTHYLSNNSSLFGLIYIIALLFELKFTYFIQPFTWIELQARSNGYEV